MNEPGQLIFFLSVAKRLMDFNNKGFTLSDALKVIDDNYPGIRLSDNSSRELCREILAKVIEEVPATVKDKTTFGYNPKFLLTSAMKGILEEAIKSKIL